MYGAGAMLALGASLIAAALALGSTEASSGGTLRIGHSGQLDVIDPALLGPFVEASEVASFTCLTPMNYADAPRAALMPEGARSFPRISGNGRTYTFRIRAGLRFNTGERVTAQTFVAAVNRTLTLHGFPAGPLGDIVGAEDVIEGRARVASGVRASGQNLVITLREPAPDFVFRTTLSGFCAVPVGLPADREGVGAPLPQAGPYYVASWVRGRRLVLRRNQLYRGPRRHHVDQVTISHNLDPGGIVSRIERGTLDTGDIPAQANARLGRRYGVNRSRYFVKPTALIYHVRLNHRRPLFRDVRMRRAANLAVDRRALVRAAERTLRDPRFGAHWGTPTDQWLTPGFPGYRAAHIYPLRGSLARARQLVRTQRGGKTAVIYTRNDEPFLSWAQLLRQGLRRVGLRPAIRSFPLDVLFERLDTPGERWDLALAGAYGPGYPDGQDIFNTIFAEAPTPARYIRMIRRAAGLTGTARRRLYGRIDVELARNVAPTAPFAALNLRTFVSRRLGCKIFRPELDLAAVCIRR